MLRRLKSLFAKNELPPYFGSAQVWVGPYGIYVCAVHRAVTGFTFPAEPSVILPSDSEAQRIGDALLMALQQCRDQQSVDLIDLAAKRTLENVGYSSWKKFERASDFITAMMSADGTQVELDRLRRRKRGGFVGTVDFPANATCDAEAAVLGKSVHELLSLNLPDYTAD